MKRGIERLLQMGVLLGLVSEGRGQREIMKVTRGLLRRRDSVMTIELRPDQERIIREQLATGRYRSVDEVLDTALSKLPDEAQSHPGARCDAARRTRPAGKKSLAQLFAESPFKGLNLDFERDRDTGRAIEL